MTQMTRNFYHTDTDDDTNDAYFLRHCLPRLWRSLSKVDASDADTSTDTRV